LEKGPTIKAKIIDELDAEKPMSIMKVVPEKQMTTKKKAIKMDALHILWAHASEKFIKATAKMLGIKVTGELSPCFGCARAKARGW
jgi:hypothetical protein